MLKGYSYSFGSDTGKYMSQQSAEMQMYSYNRMEIADQLQLARFCNTIPIIKGCIPIIKGWCYIPVLQGYIRLISLVGQPI